MREFIAEIKEEFIDFIEDFREMLGNKPAKSKKKSKTAVINGQLKVIRPAYLFAERIENGIKILFGLSLLISAFTTTFVGFASLSSLVEELIKSLFGRLLMLIIGFSYLIIAIWKTLHINKSKS